MENRTREICCDLCACCWYSPSACGWDRRTVRSGGISPAPESGTAWSSEKTASGNKQDGQGTVDHRGGQAEEQCRAHLPPKVCCRSCRWNTGSWYSGPRRNEGRSQGSWSPRRGSCCRRADGWGQSPAWRTCGETDEEIKVRIYSTTRNVELRSKGMLLCINHNYGVHSDNSWRDRIWFRASKMAAVSQRSYSWPSHQSGASGSRVYHQGLQWVSGWRHGGKKKKAPDQKIFLERLANLNSQFFPLQTVLGTGPSDPSGNHISNSLWWL